MQILCIFTKSSICSRSYFEFIPTHSNSNKSTSTLEKTPIVKITKLYLVKYFLYHKYFQTHSGKIRECFTKMSTIFSKCLMKIPQVLHKPPTKCFSSREYLEKKNINCFNKLLKVPLII